MTITPSDSPSVSVRSMRHAWCVFGILFALMVFDYALSIVPAFCAGAAFAFVMASRTYEADVRNAGVGERSGDSGFAVANA